MSDGQVLRRNVLITNPEGFHLRPQSAFAQRARQFQAVVTVIKDDRRANGKSPFELMLLTSGPGIELVVEASGADAAAALDALTVLLASPTDPDTLDPSAPTPG
jgi:phosphotransferase system HPr (HPr) family protein